jgi:hypothetical protein
VVELIERYIFLNSNAITQSQAYCYQPYSARRSKSDVPGLLPVTWNQNIATSPVLPDLNSPIHGQQA